MGEGTLSMSAREHPDQPRFELPELTYVDTHLEEQIPPPAPAHHGLAALTDAVGALFTWPPGAVAMDERTRADLGLPRQAADPRDHVFADWGLYHTR